MQAPSQSPFHGVLQRLHAIPLLLLAFHFSLCLTFQEHGIACHALITPGSALARKEAFVYQSWSLVCDQHGGCARGAAVERGR